MSKTIALASVLVVIVALCALTAYACERPPEPPVDYCESLPGIQAVDEDCPPEQEPEEPKEEPEEEVTDRGYSHGGGGACRNCEEYIRRHTPEATSTTTTTATTTPEVEEPEDAEEVEEPAACVRTMPTDFRVETGVPNDGALELYYESLADRVIARYGHENGVWLEGQIGDNTGHMTLGGLKNGQHYWIQLRDENGCFWTRAIDPLP